MPHQAKLLEQIKRTVTESRDRLVKDRLKGREMLDLLHDRLVHPDDQVLLHAAERKMRAVGRLIVLYDEFLAKPEGPYSWGMIEDLLKADEEISQLRDANRRILKRYKEEKDTDA